MVGVLRLKRGFCNYSFKIFIITFFIAIFAIISHITIVSAASTTVHVTDAIEFQAALDLAPSIYPNTMNIVMDNDIEAASGLSLLYDFPLAIPDYANIAIDGQGHRLYRTSSGSPLIVAPSTATYSTNLKISSLIVDGSSSVAGGSGPSIDLFSTIDAASLSDVHFINSVVAPLALRSKNLYLDNVSMDPVGVPGHCANAIYISTEDSAAYTSHNVLFDAKDLVIRGVNNGWGGGTGAICLWDGDSNSSTSITARIYGNSHISGNGFGSAWSSVIGMYGSVNLELAGNTIITNNNATLSGNPYSPTIGMYSFETNTSTLTIKDNAKVFGNILDGSAGGGIAVIEGNARINLFDGAQLFNNNTNVVNEIIAHPYTPTATLSVNISPNSNYAMQVADLAPSVPSFMTDEPKSDVLLTSELWDHTLSMTVFMNGTALNPTYYTVTPAGLLVDKSFFEGKPAGFYNFALTLDLQADNPIYLVTAVELIDPEAPEDTPTIPGAPNTGTSYISLNTYFATLAIIAVATGIWFTKMEGKA